MVCLLTNSKKGQGVTKQARKRKNTSTSSQVSAGQNESEILKKIEELKKT